MEIVTRSLPWGIARFFEPQYSTGNDMYLDFKCSSIIVEISRENSQFTLALFDYTINPTQGIVLAMVLHSEDYYRGEEYMWKQHTYTFADK